MSERFFSAGPVASQCVTLDGAEAHHLLHVMRAAVGQSVALFDNSGAEFQAVIESLGRSSAKLRVIERRDISRELPFSLTFGVALPKGDRQKWLIEKLTELGVTTLIPLATERGVAQPATGALERLRRSVIEASKQCGRNKLLDILEPLSWHEWLSGFPALDNAQPPTVDRIPSDMRRLLAHPGGRTLAEVDLCRPLPTLAAIGPEGGLTDAEVGAAIDAGWQPIDLGPRILRVETAAIALAAAIVANSFERPDPAW
jgi:16S rRNA (uracil1498-N3)-methyltransferase